VTDGGAVRATHATALGGAEAASGGASVVVSSFAWVDGASAALATEGDARLTLLAFGEGAPPSPRGAEGGGADEGVDGALRRVDRALHSGVPRDRHAHAASTAHGDAGKEGALLELAVAVVTIWDPRADAPWSAARADGASGAGAGAGVGAGAPAPAESASGAPRLLVAPLDRTAEFTSLAAAGGGGPSPTMLGATEAAPVAAPWVPLARAERHASLLVTAAPPQARGAPPTILALLAAWPGSARASRAALERMVEAECDASDAEAAAEAGAAGGGALSESAAASALDALLENERGSAEEAGERRRRMRGGRAAALARALRARFLDVAPSTPRVRLLALTPLIPADGIRARLADPTPLSAASTRALAQLAAEHGVVALPAWRAAAGRAAGREHGGEDLALAHALAARRWLDIFAGGAPLGVDALAELAAAAASVGAGRGAGVAALPPDLAAAQLALLLSALPDAATALVFPPGGNGIAPALRSGALAAALLRASALLAPPALAPRGAARAPPQAAFPLELDALTAFVSLLSGAVRAFRAAIATPAAARVASRWASALARSGLALPLDGLCAVASALTAHIEQRLDLYASVLEARARAVRAAAAEGLEVGGADSADALARAPAVADSAALFDAAEFRVFLAKDVVALAAHIAGHAQPGRARVAVASLRALLLSPLGAALAPLRLALAARLPLTTPPDAVAALLPPLSAALAAGIDADAPRASGCAGDGAAVAAALVRGARAVAAALAARGAAGAPSSS
jgi:hypothetical protein